MRRTDRFDAIKDNLARCRETMRDAAASAGRPLEDVSLLAVTKYVGADTIRCLHDLGIRDFGESRVQRAIALAAELKDLDDVRWHLVGHLQRNKAARALSVFHTIHSVDSVRLVDALEAAAAKRPAPELYVEVNTSREVRKTGALEENLESLLVRIAEANHLSIRGLMTMAPHSTDPETTRRSFRHLVRLRDEYIARGLLPAAAGLSMGMSNDFPVAIEEGATVVRVGSLLFRSLPEE